MTVGEPAVPGVSAVLRDLLHLAWPGSVRELLAFLPGIVMLAFLGKDADELAAGGMAIMFQNVTGVILVVSFGSAQGALVSQAFGAGSVRRCGDVLQSQLGVHGVVLLFTSALWLSAEALLLRLRQPATVAALVGRFLRIRVCALPLFALREDLDNFLNGQRIVLLPMLVSVAINALNLVCFPLAISTLGFVGAPLAQSLTQLLHVLILFPCARRATRALGTWPEWSLRKLMSGWPELLRLAMPSAGLMISEWASWEVNMVFAGLLCTGASSCADLDVFPILSNLMELAWLLFFGLYCAAGVVVGNALGAGQAATARRAAHVTVALTAALAGGTAGGSLLLRDLWARLYSTDPAILELTRRTMPAVSVYIYTAALGTGAVLFVVRSAGRVLVPAAVTFSCFYLIGIPIGLWLTFTRGWGVQGLWSGLAVAMTLAASGNLLYLLRFLDWDRAALEAQDQAKEPAQTAVKPMPGERVVGRPGYSSLANGQSAEGVEDQAMQDVEAEVELPD